MRVFGKEEMKRRYRRFGDKRVKVHSEKKPFMSRDFILFKAHARVEIRPFADLKLANRGWFRGSIYLP